MKYSSKAANQEHLIADFKYVIVELSFLFVTWSYSIVYALAGYHKCC